MDVGPFSACDLGHDAIRCPNGPLPRVSGCGLWASDFLDFSSSQDFASGWDGNGQQHPTANCQQLTDVDRPYGIFPLQIVAGFKDAERWLKDVEGVETFKDVSGCLKGVGVLKALCALHSPGHIGCIG